jgi:hypothetical protein
MNSMSPALIDQQDSVFTGTSSDITPVIEQYSLRAGTPYLSPSHIISAVLGPWGVPYWMQGLAMQTTNNNYINAPRPYLASSITHQAGNLYTAGQYGIGQAPTSGVFTGVEDHCL